MPELRAAIEAMPSLPFPGMDAARRAAAPSVEDATARYLEILFRASSEAYRRVPAMRRDRLREDFATTPARLRRARRMLEAARNG